METEGQGLLVGVFLSFRGGWRLRFLVFWGRTEVGEHVWSLDMERLSLNVFLYKVLLAPPQEQEITGL